MDVIGAFLIFFVGAYLGFAGSFLWRMHKTEQERRLRELLREELRK